MKTLGNRVAAWTAAALTVSALACSAEKNPGPSGTGGSGTGGGGGTPAYATNGPGECPSTVRPVNDAFCNGQCMAPASCSATGRPIDSCCVMVGEPGHDKSSPYLVRTTDTKEYADPSGKPPNLSCFEPAGYPPQPPAGGTSKKASIKGELRPFANGGCAPGDLLGITMEIYTVQRTGDPATDGALGQLVGTALVVNDQMPVIEETVQNKCDGDLRYNREFEYPDVPMYTELVLKTSGPGWAALYAYNIYVSESDPDFDAGTSSYTYNARALAEDDFATIPTVAIAHTITPGNGAVGGEVHDCDNIRLQNARVDVSVPRVGLVYFNADEDNPLPTDARKDIGTGRTALYSALDVTVTGPEGVYARVAGTGLIPDGESSKLVSLGYVDVRVFPDSVTSVSLRGLRPFQVP